MTMAMDSMKISTRNIALNAKKNFSLAPLLVTHLLPTAKRAIVTGESGNTAQGIIWTLGNASANIARGTRGGEND